LRFTHGKPKVPNRKVSINLLGTYDGFGLAIEGKGKYHFCSVTVSMFIPC